MTYSAVEIFCSFDTYLFCKEHYPKRVIQANKTVPSGEFLYFNKKSKLARLAVVRGGEVVQIYGVTYKYDDQAYST